MNGHILSTAPAPIGAHERLTDSASQHVAAALRTCALGERVTWDTALQVVGGPNGQPAAAVAVYLQIPSPLVGQCMYELAIIEAAQANETTITAAVTDSVGRLFAARAQVAALPATN